MDIIVKKFEELDVNELYEIMQARAEVFVVEQECAYQDLDGVDKEAYHVYLRENGELVAYLRVLDKGKRLDEVSVGRVISLKRGLGLGKRLMRAGLQVAKEKFGATIVKVGAQVQAKGFYESVGFRQVSGEYDEDGIPHIYMIYEENSGAGTR
ncbi:MAG: GNAT family N-acetyltransferase [Clostridiales bacterium]|nr:GNAT family N-acetyltransferase [Clostridiales bacterium]